MNLVVKFKIALIIMLVFLVNTIGWALPLPLPPDTKIIREETVEMGGENKKITFCTSGLNKEKISSFYRKELEKRGYNIFMQQAGLLIYLKGDNLFLVMLAGDSAAGQKISIILTETKMGGLGGKPQVLSCEDVPSVPVYPGARCLGSMRLKSSKSVLVRYLASAELEDVRNFYLLRLPQGGWVLEQETNAGEYIPQQFFPGADAGLNLNLQKSSITIFKSLKNERCTIAFMPSLIGSGTMINITYEEAK